MMWPLHRRSSMLGALLSAQAQGTYYDTYVSPSYSALSGAHADINTLVMSRSDFQAELDRFHDELTALDNALTQLDSANEAQWTSGIQDLQRRLGEFTTRVKIAKHSQSIGLTLIAGGVAYGTSWAFMKRIPRVRRSYYAAGFGLLGGGAAQLWWRNRG